MGGRVNSFFDDIVYDGGFGILAMGAQSRREIGEDRDS